MPRAKVVKPRVEFRHSKPPGPDQGKAGRSVHSVVALLGLPVSDNTGLRERIREGLSYRAWDRFLESTGLPKETVIQVVQMTSRTLARRRDEGRLHSQESDRLVRAARIFSLAVGLFDGDDDAARLWLARSQQALGGSTPWDYAGTEIGAREVENLIGRLENGIPS
jgi:putative toxin-antitoxin system antitoxin component (TIGR02293 family)